MIAFETLHTVSSPHRSAIRTPPQTSQLLAFLASCTYLLGMLSSVVFGVYPMVLPARNSAYALTVQNAKAPEYGLKIGLLWWVIGMTLAAVYFVHVYRSFSGKVSPEGAGHG
jgi:cytochrome d ubiquinol oxidase subunit II